jgi:hypothetical protein
MPHSSVSPVITVQIIDCGRLPVSTGEWGLITRSAQERRTEPVRRWLVRHATFARSVHGAAATVALPPDPAAGRDRPAPQPFAIAIVVAVVEIERETGRPKKPRAPAPIARAPIIARSAIDPSGADPIASAGTAIDNTGTRPPRGTRGSVFDSRSRAGEAGICAANSGTCARAASTRATSRCTRAGASAPVRAGAWPWPASA